MSTTVGGIGGTYGLSGSGMDIDSLVKKLMAGEQAKEDALNQKKTVLQWQKSAYNTVYDDISNFRSMVFNYKLQSTLSPNKVSSSNTSVATATANAGAADVNHSLEVAQLASGVNLTSSGSITPNGADKSTLSTQLGVSGSFAINISDGVTTKSINITSTESINQVVSDINSSGLNLQANYDSTLDRFFLSTTKTGSSAQISMSSTVTTGTTPDPGANFLESLQLFTANGSPVDNVNGTTTTTFLSSPGKNAEFKLDDVHLTESSNTFSISGVTYSLTGVSSGSTMNNDPAQITWGDSTNVSVINDIDTAVTSVQSLVDSYNKILSELNSKVDEERYKDYSPLTDAQKASMKDSDITLWNAKAQSGMLHNDPTLTSLINTMRNAFSSPVSGVTGTYNSASSIGITTGDYTEGGKLYLNTDKLRTALQANPNVLNQLFGSTGTTTTTNGVTKTDTSTQGIAGRLYDGIKNTMDQLKTIAGTTANAQYDTNSNYAKQITTINTQISTESDRYDTMQAAYYKQYNAMELAIQQLSSQSSWLSSMLGGSSS